MCVGLAFGSVVTLSLGRSSTSLSEAIGANLCDLVTLASATAQRNQLLQWFLAQDPWFRLALCVVRMLPARFAVLCASPAYLLSFLGCHASVLVAVLQMGHVAHVPEQRLM